MPNKKNSENLNKPTKDLSMQMILVIPTSNLEASQEIFCRIFDYSTLGLFEAGDVVPNRILLQHPDAVSGIWLEEVKMQKGTNKGLVYKHFVPYVEFVFNSYGEMDDRLNQMFNPVSAAVSSGEGINDKDCFAFFERHGQKVRIFTTDYYKSTYGRALPDWL